MSNRVLAASKCCSRHYIVRMIKPKLHRFLTTGMFNLIVKDPRRIPPERAALDQGIRSLAACPRTCCAAFRGVMKDSSVLSAFTESIEISGGCQWIFSICSARLAAPNLKDRPQFPACLTHRVGGQFCPGGIISLALQWIVRSGRTFLLYRTFC